LKGDEERCLAAGMDGYVSKPIRSQELFRVIEKHVRAADVSVPSAPTPPIPAETLDAASVLDRMGGDADLLQELVEVFWDDCPKLMSDIRKSLDDQSAKDLRDAAHALKGSLCNFGANSACEAALKLETLGRDGNLDRAEEVFTALEEGLSRLKPALVALEKECGSGHP
jgi:two-component system, sensor histidine kinase and response regulator